MKESKGGEKGPPPLLNDSLEGYIETRGLYSLSLFRIVCIVQVS